jgi:formylglycine-generating enzyme required for sulfatase activity
MGHGKERASIMLRKYGKRGLTLLAVMFFSCAPLLNDHARPVELPHPWMKKISSSGQSFLQGWNDSLASSDEKPGMKSTFTYDYWIDSTEVTRKQYSDITGRNPVSDSGQYGIGGQYPVSFVTWFDAVLFCNARSKADGLDSVYSYTRRYTVPGGGSVYDLTDLKCDFSKDGYRLPTESEWEFAARGGSSALPYRALSELINAESAAWFGANSSGTMHPVAAKTPNSLGLYDLAGNVFEWTNDWKGAYSGNDILNSLGSIQGNINIEKVVKGGSYGFGLTCLRPSYRSPAFITSCSSLFEQVGFRCARGAIPGGRYIGVPFSDVFNFAYDSIGLYNDPLPSFEDGGFQKDFAIKMHLFWKFHREADLIFLGDAISYCGIDCSRFIKHKSFNMGFTGCGLYFISAIASEYLFVHAPRLKLLAMGVPFFNEAFQRFPDSASLHIKGYNYDKNHNFWKDGVPLGFDDVMAQQPYPLLEDNWWDSLGLRQSDCWGWGDTVPDVFWAKKWTIKDSAYMKQFAALCSLIKECSARHIHLLVINFPVSPYYRNTEFCIGSGPERETGKEVVAQIKALEMLYPYFHVYDANLEGKHDYSDGDATSADRLCPNGAKKISDRLNKFIDSILTR